MTTLGGGIVLDPWAPRARQRDHVRVAGELSALDAGDTTVLLRRAGDAGLTPAAATLRGVTAGVQLSDLRFADKRVIELENALTSALAGYHAQRPLSPGAPRRDLHRAPIGHLPQRVYDALLERLELREMIVVEGPRMRLPDFSVQMTTDQQARFDSLARDLLACGLQGPKAAELLAKEAELTHLHIESRAFVRVADKLLHRDNLDNLVARVRAFLADHDEMRATDFKALTNLSRKHAIPLLEWLDSQRVTVRVGEGRQLRGG